MDKRKACVVVACILIVVVTVVYSLYVLVLKSRRSLFENYYLNIAKNLNSCDTKTEVRSWFERDYNYTELCQWVYSNLEYIPLNESFDRSTDPIEILENKKGRCGEFSYLYVAACLAHGYDSRFVVATDITNSSREDPHAWAEVKVNNNWVHVDPTGNAWNDPYRYERCETGDWGKELGSTIRIYAIEKSSCKDVTLSYLSKSQEN
jgi:hypothetical protein